jgi:hypothetical protein
MYALLFKAMQSNLAGWSLIRLSEVRVQHSSIP